jgi:hypothetical protein
MNTPLEQVETGTSHSWNVISCGQIPWCESHCRPPSWQVWPHNNRTALFIRFREGRNPSCGHRLLQLRALSQRTIFFGVRFGGLKAWKLEAEAVVTHPITCSCVISRCRHAACSVIEITPCRTKLDLSDLKIQLIPRSKHIPSRL